MGMGGEEKSTFRDCAQGREQRGKNPGRLLRSLAGRGIHLRYVGL